MILDWTHTPQGQLSNALLRPPNEVDCFDMDSLTMANGVPGLALGIAMLGLPWKVISVIVAADEAYHRNQTALLSNSFLEAFPASVAPGTLLIPLLARCSKNVNFISKFVPI